MHKHSDRLKRHKKVKEKARIRAISQRTPLIILPNSKDYKDNSCGSCTACCTALGVQALKKNIWVQCDHVCEGGCSIYADRPPECKSYYCLYQAGMLKGGEEMRPDNLGMIFEIRGTDEISFVFAWELFEGAENQEKVKCLIKGIAASGVCRCIIVRKYLTETKFSYYGPRNLQERMIDLLKAGLQVDKKLLEGDAHGL